MKRWLIVGLVLSASGFPLLLAEPVLMDLLYISRGSVVMQTSATEVTVSDPGWTFGAGGEMIYGVADDLRVAGPGFPEGVLIPIFEDDPQDHELNLYFDSRQQLEEYAPAGTYTFTWTSDGELTNESVQAEAFAPLEPKKLTNWDQLQAIDPSQVTTLSWEPFTDLNGKDGFVEVEVYYEHDGSEHIVWSSGEDEDDFGLDPSTTMVEIPPYYLTGNPANTYVVEVYFARIERFESQESYFLGAKGIATTAETRAVLRTLDPQRIVLTPGEWTHSDMLGWIYGSTPEWGYSFDLGWVHVGWTPRHVFQANLGWLVPVSGTMRDGIWFHDLQGGWVYTKEAYGGAYADPGGNWRNLIRPDQ
ncbi:MAG: hypothetical protein ACP5I4_14840 [Oceanipulchritudo sp.]